MRLPLSPNLSPNPTSRPLATPSSNCDGRRVSGRPIVRHRPLALCSGRPLRRYNSIFVTGLGFSMALLFQLKASSERLRGFKDNEGECARVGVEFAKA